MRFCNFLQKHYGPTYGQTLEDAYKKENVSMMRCDFMKYG